MTDSSEEILQQLDPEIRAQLLASTKEELMVHLLPILKLAQEGRIEIASGILSIPVQKKLRKDLSTKRRTDEQ